MGRGPEKPTHTLSSVQRSFDILEELVHMNGAGVTDLAERLDMNKSTLHAHLRTLESCGYVVNENGNYRGSLKSLHLGAVVRGNIPIFGDSFDYVSELARSTGELANLGVKERGTVVVIAMVEGPDAVFGKIGIQMDFHASAMGKAMLANFPEDEMMALIDKPLEAQTEHTITDRDTLIKELETIRSQDYAIEREEWTPGIWSIAAPILDIDDYPVAAVSVAGPAKKFRHDAHRDELIRQLLNIANTIEVKLQNPR